MKRIPKIFYLAWSLFLFSLFLPAAESQRGWQCALICAELPFDNKWDGGAVYYFMFTLPNLLMLLSPLAVVLWAGKKRKTHVLLGFALFSALYVLSFWVINMFSSGGMNLQIGYYLWTISFFALFAAILQLSRTAARSGNTPEFSAVTP